MKKLLFLFLLAFSASPGVADDSVSGPGGTFISQILDEATNLTRRSKLNFTGAGISCVDNSASKRIDCTITTTGSGGGATSLVVNYNDVLVSSPTSTLNFMPPLIVTLQGGTSAQIRLSPISLSTGVVGSVDISTQTNLAVVSPLILTNDTLSISQISLSTGVVGPLNIASGTITQFYPSTITFADGSVQTTAFTSAAGDITAVNAGTGLTGGGIVGSVTLSVDSTYSGFIHNRDALQAGATAYPQFLQVGTSGAQIHGPLNVDGVITASGTAITTSAGLLDATKLTGLVPNASIDTSSITKMGNTFNTANKLLQLDASADVPDANLSSNVSLLGSSIDISAETNLGAIAPLGLSGDNVFIDTNSVGGAFILNTNTLQAGTTFHVTSGTVAGQFYVKNSTPVPQEGSLTFNSVFSATTFGVLKVNEQYIYSHAPHLSGSATTNRLMLYASTAPWSQNLQLEDVGFGSYNVTRKPGDSYFYVEPNGNLGMVAGGTGNSSAFTYSAGRFYLANGDGDLAMSVDYTQDNFTSFGGANPVFFETGIVIDNNWNPGNSNRHWLRFGKVDSGDVDTHSAFRYGPESGDGVGFQIRVTGTEFAEEGDPSVRVEIEDNCSAPDCETMFTDNIEIRKTYGEGAMRMYDNDASHYVAFKASETVTSTMTFVMPASSSTVTVGQLLKVTSISGTRINLDFAKVAEHKSKASLQSDSPVAAGEIYYCTDCTVDGVVVSTGTAAGSVARISARTTAIQ